MSLVGWPSARSYIGVARLVTSLIFPYYSAPYCVFGVLKDGSCKFYLNTFQVGRTALERCLGQGLHLTWH